MPRGKHYDAFSALDAEFQAPAYTVSGWAGIAWRCLGWETEPDADTEWTGIEERTGRVVCIMIGDDHKFTFEPEDVTAIAREDYCSECGQIGCTLDGLDRSEDAK